MARLLLIVLAALFCGMLVRPALAGDAMLKSAPEVDGAFVTLGTLFHADAFAAAPATAEIRVAAAPPPGRTTAFDARALQRFAARHGVTWPNAERLDAVVVARASTLIGAPEIERALLAALPAPTLDTRQRIRFAGAPPSLAIAAGADPAIAVTAIDVDPSTGQFRAQIEATDKTAHASAMTVSGRVYGVTDMPVLARDLRPGESLSEADILWSEVASERLSQNIHTEVASLMGQTPRRLLRAGQPLRLGDFEAPIVVKKDALVSMIVRLPGMALTAQGRALQNGALGDTIRVMNTHSKRTVEATVEGPGDVVVLTGAARAALAQR